MDGEVDLAEKLSLFSEHRAPRTVVGFDGHDVVLVEVQGEFVWHKGVAWASRRSDSSYAPGYKWGGSAR